MAMPGLIISSEVRQMERKTPTREHLEALYDLINELMPDKDVYHTDEELGKLQTSKGIELI